MKEQRMTISASFRSFTLAALLALTVVSAPVHAQQYQQELRHAPAICQGAGPAVLLSVTSIKAGTGIIRAQLYYATAEDWLASGRWLHRIEMPARAGTMSICMPVPAAGDYAIAVRHDVNGNGSTDISTDGGAMSNNPSINIFNLGRPSVNRTRFTIGRQVLPMTIRMRYL